MRDADRSRPDMRAPAAAAVLALCAGLAAAAPTPAQLATSPLAAGDAPAAGVCTGPCAHHAPGATHPMMQAVDALAARADNPPAERLRILERLRLSSTCYAPDLSPEEYADLIARTGLLPAGMDPTLRFFNAGTVWLGEGAQGQDGIARRANLTYSFPADGASWGIAGSGFGSPSPNTLNQMFSNMFGPSNIDRGRELVRQSLAGWRRAGGLTYREVADDNTAQSTSAVRSPLRGDIRIGGFPFINAGGVLAYNVFPTDGGDMAINTNSQASFAQSGSNYRFFRNVVAHEHGHGLGMIHSIPCAGIFLMEPTISTGFDMVTIDERRAVGHNHGDRYSGNPAPTLAVDLGDLTAPALRSVIERDLSTNGQTGALGSSNDYFRFTLSSPQPVTISATPTGGGYTQGQQSNFGGCNGATAFVNASQAGNLNIELRAADGVTVLQTAAAAPAGQTETLNAGTLAAGTYVVRVLDAGPNPVANQVVQLYDLTLRVASAPASPQAIAGLHKRIEANRNCFFMGNINSRAGESNAFISTTGYAWDLDGDGTFEILGNPQPTRQYPSNGVYDVTLRVTDSSGAVGTDTIEVTVFGATTAVTNVTPDLGAQGDAVPITITGTNLKNVTDASMVTVSGSGVTVTGTPTPNALGTFVTGLSLEIAPGAAVGERNITVANADGSATGVGLFTVEEGAGNPCPADWNQDEAVNSGDISAFLTSWIASVQAGDLVADFDASGSTNSGDISAFLTAWIDAVTNGC